MCNDLDDLLYKALILSDLPIPSVDEFLDDDCYESIELQIDLIAARQRREQLVNRSRRAATFVAMVRT